MSITITERLRCLRNYLEKAGLQACIIPSSDPHKSEYTADCWKFRQYVSGFSGSAGTLVVGLCKAGLWTDSRYFLQAETELKGSDIELFRIGTEGTPSPEQWIIQEGYKAVGVDGTIFSHKEILSMCDLFHQKDIRLETHFEPYGPVWKDRPASPNGKIYAFPERFCGENTGSKTERLRSEILKAGADGTVLSALDEVAWLLNLRGEDVRYNPVGICYTFVDQKNVVLFADSSKFSPETIDYLEENHIQLSAYDSLPHFLTSLNPMTILLDSGQINYNLFQRIPTNCKIIKDTSPVKWMKAIKNPVEISGFRKAMIKDGVALTRFWIWLEQTINNPDEKGRPNEYTIGEEIIKFRQEQEHYMSESFSSIVGYNEHGAIVHYEAAPESAYTIDPEGFLLIDTGGQYLNGTTDITRSWSFHTQTPVSYKKDYTSLIKGLIALSSATFPTGTRGTQLDVLARQFLWQRQLNFGHGTGHGVGHFLNVHEGPQSIRTNENPATLESGMILSNEPGIYRPGEYGIRIENLVLVCEKGTSDFGKFLKFETLTLLPFDLKSIEKESLSQEEINWINQYHQTVYHRLSPALNETECQWLKKKTRELI